MTETKFKFWNRMMALLTFVVAAVTYLLTIEPTASFWDCGEFIASSYKLEVGHPPGNPTFQLFARLFTMFGGNMQAAMLVNALSAICSALTILFLYLTIVWFARRMVLRASDGGMGKGESIAILGSGVVGALAYCFSDTFWFSAVEGEVYAMSSLFTAVVFWAMTRWYDTADEPHSSRWIVLIAFLMGLSIGVHLLNLLAIPALVFMYYYRQREDGRFTFWEFVKIFLIGVVLLGVINFIVIPWLPKVAATFDRFFVNSFGLPYNTGAAFFMVALLSLCFWGIFGTLKKKKVFWNTALLCFTTIVIGFSIFSIDIIRSSAKTPTNEYQPDNAYTLVRYLSREQYGSAPLITGAHYDADPIDYKPAKYWAPLDGEYKEVDGPGTYVYASEDKMFFPRMWSYLPEMKDFYDAYRSPASLSVQGSKPTFGENLSFFFDYQLNWMYWRYFMWNFVGRQNDIHSPSPGNIFHGNWESGIGFIDKARLGDQSDAPEVLAGNKGKNHYFFLPLLLGLLGLCFQFGEDKRGCWLNFLMFFMTGIAIVLYLNQPPFQVRERDYAYAGSFYFFSAWIGLGVMALFKWIKGLANGKGEAAVACVVVVASLFVPVLMAAQNWDDHDRSGRRTAPELGANYLKSVGPQGTLITHGDNDTFPLWYAQEVEDVRTDVRICNTSLLGTDWHIDQMKWACNESKPLALSIGPRQYLYGTNETIPINDARGGVMDIKKVISKFKDPKDRVQMTSRNWYDYIASRKIAVPVNKENALRCGIVAPEDASRMLDTLILEIPKEMKYLSKPDLFVLDYLSNYQWDRPFNVLANGGDINVGIKKYLEYTGFSAKLVPYPNTAGMSRITYVNPDELYRLMTEVYSFDAISSDGWFIDYQNYYTFLGVMNIRELFLNCAEVFEKSGRNDRAVEMLDKGMYIMRRFPLCTVSLGFRNNDIMVLHVIEEYYKLGEKEKADALAEQYAGELLQHTDFYFNFLDYGESEAELCWGLLYNLIDRVKTGGNKELADSITASLEEIFNKYGITESD